MNEKIYTLALALHDALENNPDVLKLKETEKASEENATVAALLKEYENVKQTINELVEHYDFESKEVKEKRNFLSKIKYVLDNEPLIKCYNKQFKIVSKMYEEISNEIINALGLNREITCSLLAE